MGGHDGAPSGANPQRAGGIGYLHQSRIYADLERLSEPDGVFRPAHPEIGQPGLELIIAMVNLSGQGVQQAVDQAKLRLIAILSVMIVVDGKSGIVIQGHQRAVGKTQLHLAIHGDNAIPAKQFFPIRWRLAFVAVQNINLAGKG